MNTRLLIIILFTLNFSVCSIAQNSCNPVEIEQVDSIVLKSSLVAALPYGCDILLNHFDDQWDFAKKDNKKSRNEVCLDSLMNEFYFKFEKKENLLPSYSQSISKLLCDSALFIRDNIYIDSAESIHSIRIDCENAFSLYAVMLQKSNTHSELEFEENQQVEALVLLNKGVVKDKLIFSSIIGSDLGRAMCFSYIDTLQIIHTKYFAHDEEKEYFDRYKKHTISPQGKFIRYYEQNGDYANEWEKGRVQNHTREGRWEDINARYIIDSEYAAGLPVGEWKYYLLEQECDDEGHIILSSRKKGRLCATEKYQNGELVDRKEL